MVTHPIHEKGNRYVVAVYQFTNHHRLVCSITMGHRRWLRVHLTAFVWILNHCGDKEKVPMPLRSRSCEAEDDRKLKPINEKRICSKKKWALNVKIARSINISRAIYISLHQQYNNIQPTEESDSAFDRCMHNYVIFNLEANRNSFIFRF